jgi:hypothetical protein
MSYVNEDKQFVVTYKELVFIVFVFIAILVALYPKDLLKQFYLVSRILRRSQKLLNSEMWDHKNS